MHSRFSVLAFAATILLGLTITSGQVHSAPADPDGVHAPQVRSLIPEFSGTYGGAFSHLHVINNLAVVIEGTNRVAIYDATDTWTGGSSTFHPLPKLIARTFHISDNVYDLEVEKSADGTIHLHILSQRSSWTLVDRWLFKDGHLSQTSDSYMAPDGYIMALGENFVYVLGADLVMLDKMTLETVKTIRPPEGRWGAMDYNEGKIFLGRLGNVEIFDASTLVQTGAIEIGHAISQIDAKGDCVMVRHVPFEGTGPEDHDFTVFQHVNSSYIRILTANDGAGLRYSYEPETSGTLAEGQLLVAGGWNGFMAWDLKSGKQVLEGNRLTSRFASEVLRVEKAVYIVDHFMGIRTTAWGDDQRGVGGYFQTRPLIPSLSDAEMVGAYGRFIVTAGKAGLYVYDTTKDQITGYTTWFTNGEGFPMSNDYDMEVVGREVWAGDYSSFFRYNITDDGRLAELSNVDWTGGRFAIMGDKVVSITTDYGRPTVMTVFDPRTGEVAMTKTVTHNQHGLDVAVSGNRIYILTERGVDSQLISYTYNPNTEVAVIGWKLESNNVTKLTVSGKYIWTGERGPGFSVYEDQGAEAVYIDGDYDRNLTLAFGAFGNWGFVSTAHGFDLYQAGHELTRLGMYSTHEGGGGWHMEDIAVHNNQVVLGLGAWGIEIANWNWSTHRVFLPATLSSGRVGWCSDVNICSIIDGNCVCGSP